MTDFDCFQNYLAHSAFYNTAKTVSLENMKTNPFLKKFCNF